LWLLRIDSPPHKQAAQGEWRPLAGATTVLSPMDWERSRAASISTRIAFVFLNAFGGDALGGPIAAQERFLDIGVL